MNAPKQEAVSLSETLENQLLDLQAQSWELIEEDKLEEALSKSFQAWNLVPEPKFNSTFSILILSDLIEILNISGKSFEAKKLLQQCIADLKSGNFSFNEIYPFILLAETHLYLSEINDAKKVLQETISLGADENNFIEKPSFYFDIATQKITDNNQIQQLFEALFTESDENFDGEDSKLSHELASQIEILSEDANDLFDDEEYQPAIVIWKEALALIPKPQSYYSETMWLEISIGDAYFMSGKHELALTHFLNAKKNTEIDVYQNAFVMLRLGQLYFETNDFILAKDYLRRAYNLDGIEIFEGSKEKYVLFLEINNLD